MNRTRARIAPAGSVPNGPVRARRFDRGQRLSRVSRSGRFQGRKKTRTVGERIDQHRRPRQRCETFAAARWHLRMAGLPMEFVIGDRGRGVVTGYTLRTDAS